jgi:hypothetical protein
MKHASIILVALLIITSCSSDETPITQLPQTIYPAFGTETAYSHKIVMR